MRKLGALLKELGVDARSLAAGDIAVRSPIDGGEIARLQSDTRSSVAKKVARADEGTPRGSVFVPFCYYEAAANMLTNPVLDPFGKIPEFKYCAVKVTAGGTVPAKMTFGGGKILGEAHRT